MQYASIAQIASHLFSRQLLSVRCQQPLISGALRGLADSMHATPALMLVASPSILDMPTIALGPVA